MVRNRWLGCRVRRMAYSYGLRKAAPPNTLTDRATNSVRSWALKIKIGCALATKVGRQAVESPLIA